MSVRAHLVINGSVQGVCFRMYTRDEARRLGVTGWVRNRTDGTVELVAEGSKEAVTALSAWCRHGPSYAHVTDVQCNTGAATGEFADFRILY